MMTRMMMMPFWCLPVSVWSLWRVLRSLCWSWEEEDTQWGTWLAAGKSHTHTHTHTQVSFSTHNMGLKVKSWWQLWVIRWVSVFPLTAALLCRRTFETSLLLDESISDELPYSGELASQSLPCVMHLCVSPTEVCWSFSVCSTTCWRSRDPTLFL